jgi:hypothetical protein
MGFFLSGKPMAYPMVEGYISQECAIMYHDGQKAKRFGAIPFSVYV